MKKRLLLLDLVLAALVIVLGLRVRDAWLEARKREQVVLGQPLKQLPPPPYAPLKKAEPVMAASYAAIAQEMLWSEDRNPAVVVAEAPPPPMPALPAMYGIFDLGDGPTAIMSVKAGGAHEEVRAGGKIGEFTLAALSADQVTLAWRDKTVTKKVEDLVDRGGGAAAQQEAARATAAPRPEGRPQAVAPASATGPGMDIGNGSKVCQRGDNSPVGTVQDGFKKVVQVTPYGQLCRWEPVK